MKKKTQAEDIAALTQRVKNLEDNSFTGLFAKIWQFKNGADEGAMQAMVERWSPSIHHSSNRIAITAIVLVFILLVAVAGLAFGIQGEIDSLRAMMADAKASINKKVDIPVTEMATTATTNFCGGLCTTGVPKTVIPESIVGDRTVQHHRLHLLVMATCWLRVTENTPTAKLLVESQVAANYEKEFSFDEETTIEVRAGCPGAVRYELNGTYVNPPNVSQKPDKSEVVDLRL